MVGCSKPRVSEGGYAGHLRVGVGGRVFATKVIPCDEFSKKNREGKRGTNRKTGRSSREHLRDDEWKPS